MTGDKEGDFLKMRKPLMVFDINIAWSLTAGAEFLNGQRSLNGHDPIISEEGI